MAKKIRRKSTFESAHIDHFRPSLTDKAPKAINMILSFEDALKLHLSLGQVLGHLNGYDRRQATGCEPLYLSRSTASYRERKQNQKNGEKESRQVNLWHYQSSRRPESAFREYRERLG